MYNVKKLILLTTPLCCWNVCVIQWTYSELTVNLRIVVSVMNSSPGHTTKRIKLQSTSRFLSWCAVKINSLCKLPSRTKLIFHWGLNYDCMVRGILTATTLTNVEVRAAFGGGEASFPLDFRKVKIEYVRFTPLSPSQTNFRMQPCRFFKFYTGNGGWCGDCML